SLRNTAQQTFLTDALYKRRIMGVFADAIFGFRDYLFVQLTGRNDWSSTLPASSQSYFYPGVSTAFVFSDALNLQSNFFSYGKVRAAWAKVGRDTDPYNLANVYVFDTNFRDQPTGGLSSTSYDPLLTPEFTREVELGTELAFLNNRVNLDFS